MPRSAPPPTRIATPSGDGRIDRAGPVHVTTVEPIPVGAGMPPTRLLIPALGLDTPVQTMGWKIIEDENGVRSEWEVVDFAAGHHINSAFPGEPGNVVLSGHNNIAGAVFQSVCVIGEPGVDFGLGDEMILEDKLGRRFIYQVNSWRRLEEANASIARRQENAQYLNPTTFAQLTLVTCWPPTSNTHRVIVTGLLSGRE
ncbi:MAG TPA: sortase [Caldilineae bacterium]|nr:sortase [Caldilineae bacterium]